MSRRATGRLGTHAALATAALLGALASGRPELAALGLPSAVAVVVGLLGAPRADITVTLQLDATRAVEGDTVGVEIVAVSEVALPWVEVALQLPWPLEAVGGPAVVLAVAPGVRATGTLPVRCHRWGAYRPCRATVTAYDRHRMFVSHFAVAAPAVLRIHPPTTALRRRLHPLRLLALTGGHQSRTRGDGIEFADTRPFVVGDRMRSVNWRASARRSGLWVNERHPDRNADVVLFLDSFAEAGADLDTTLDRAVEATVAIATVHAAAHDRIGLVGLGGVLRWMAPALGLAQLHRLVDAVLDTAIVASEAEKGIDVVPVRGLPPRAMVVAVTPLLDRRSEALMAELAGRGFDLTVIECSPAGFVAPGTRPAEQAAYRLWMLEREMVRAQLRSAGAALVEWGRGEPLPAALESARIWRRVPRVVHP